MGPMQCAHVQFALGPSDQVASWRNRQFSLKHQQFQQIKQADDRLIASPRKNPEIQKICNSENPDNLAKSYVSQARHGNQ
jgi:hypothetical protein